MPATAEAASRARSRSIYADALTTGWVADSPHRRATTSHTWATLNLANPSPVNSGTDSIAATFSASSALQLRHTAGTLSGLATLTLFVNGGANSVVHLEVWATEGTTQTGPVDLGAYCAAGKIPQNAWTECQVPLSALGTDGPTLDGLVLQESDGVARSVLYLDDIGLSNPSTAPALPAAPANLSATPSQGAVALSWSAASGATGYDVWRATSSTGTFARLTATSQALTTYPDQAVTAGSTYYYQVTASDAAGTGPACTTVSATVPAAQAIGVTVTPSSIAIDECSVHAFQAQVTGTTDTQVAWSVLEGAAGGTVDASGNYTAPSTGGTYHVVATSHASSASTASSAVTTAEHVLSVSMSPAAVNLAPGGTAQLTATVTNTCGTIVSSQTVTAPPRR